MLGLFLLAGPTPTRRESTGTKLAWFGVRHETNVKLHCYIFWLCCTFISQALNILEVRTAQVIQELGVQEPDDAMGGELGLNGNGMNTPYAPLVEPNGYTNGTMAY